jgi:hypothetical protein
LGQLPRIQSAIVKFKDSLLPGSELGLMPRSNP